MRRRQYFEFCDQAWWPRLIRDAQTDFLAFLLCKGNQYASAIRWLALALDKCETDEIVDLCSGGGGPWPSLVKALHAERQRAVSVCLTDKYPNVTALSAEVHRAEGALQFCAISVDATAVPADLHGVRTLFTALPHFTPIQVQAIMQDAVRQRRGLCAFEVTQRSILAIVLTCISPLTVLCVTPFIRPFRLSRLVLTYLIPILPLVTLFDGIVSCLRTYSPTDLRALIDEASLQTYTWHIGEDSIRFAPIPMTYLVGYPKLGENVDDQHFATPGSH
jgi:hypothetical protein